MNKNTGYNWKLGMFVIIGLVLFVATIYFVGEQKNIFGSTISLKAKFKNVSGLKEGNNIRFSGINIGTVGSIDLITDTSIMVSMVIKDEVVKFLRTDAVAIIGSDGLMGDKVLTIIAGTTGGRTVKSGDTITSKKALDMEDIMAGVKTSVDNAGLITAQLAQFTYNMNNGKGALTRLMNDESFSKSLESTLTNLETSSKQFSTFASKMNNAKGALAKVVTDEQFANSLDSVMTNLQNTTAEFASFTAKMNNGKGALSKVTTDEAFANSLTSTMTNLQTSSQKLDESMEAIQHNFLLRGFFKKKAKAAAKQEAADKKAADKQAKSVVTKGTGVSTVKDTSLPGPKN